MLCNYEPFNFTFWLLIFYLSHKGIIKFDYLQITLQLGHSIKWMKSGKIWNMLIYPSWTSMHYVLVFVCNARTWEYFRKHWHPTRQGMGRSMLVFCWTSASLLSFHYSTTETESKLFYKVTGNPVTVVIDYLPPLLIVFMSCFSKLSMKWIWMGERWVWVVKSPTLVVWSVGLGPAQPVTDQCYSSFIHSLIYSGTPTLCVRPWARHLRK